MNKLELRIGKRVIAETPSVNIDSMVSLVRRFMEIRNDDSMWEPSEDPISGNAVLPCFHAFEKPLSESGIATACIFDVFEKATVWNVNRMGDSVKVTTVWNRGF